MTTMYGVGTADGVNEKGFAVHLLYLTATDFGARDGGKLGIHAGLWGQYLLDGASTVTEALALMNGIQPVMVSVDGREATVHVAIEDANGAAALFAWNAIASAQQLENPRTDYTAYTRPRGRVAVGFLKSDLGVIDEITIGTYPLPWLAVPLLKTTVPNAYLKIRSPWSGPLTLALGGSAMYVNGKAIAQLADQNASASAISTTAEFDASYRFDERFTLSLGLDYAHLRVVGDTQDEATSVEGASTGHTYSTRLLGEWRLSQVFALSLLFRYLIYQSPYSANAASSNGIVMVTSDLTAQGALQRHFTLVPGVSFEWKHWELNVGAGYGVFYLPVFGLATAKAWPVVDLAFAYRFDLYH